LDANSDRLLDCDGNLDPMPPGQGEVEGVRPPLPVPVRRRRGVEPPCEGEPWQVEPEPIGLLEGDPKVLEEVLDEEAGPEIAAEHPWGKVGDGPRPGRPAADRRQHPLRVESRLRRVEEPLDDAEHGAGDQDLVHHLGVLTGSGPSLENDRLPKPLENRFRHREGLVRAAHHDGERRLPGPDVTAGHRSIQCEDAERPCLAGESFGQGWLTRGEVDEEPWPPSRSERPLQPEVHLLDIAREPDHRADDIGALGRIPRRRDQRRAKFAKRLRAARRPGHDTKPVARGEEVFRHGEAHHAGSDESDRAQRRIVGAAGSGAAGSVWRFA
jgi:hypothetical protein